MRRSLVCALLLVCLLAWAGSALAGEAMPGEQVVVETGYAGDWYWFADFQFGLLLPQTWQPVAAGDEIYFMAVDQSGKQALWVELYASQGNSMDTVLEDLAAIPGFSAVEGVYYNKVPFVRYTATEGNLLGFVTLTAKEDILLFFKFLPSDDPALQDLAMRIMATVSPVNRTGEEEQDQSGGNAP